MPSKKSNKKKHKKPVTHSDITTHFQDSLNLQEEIKDSDNTEAEGKILKENQEHQKDAFTASEICVQDEQEESVKKENHPNEEDLRDKVLKMDFWTTILAGSEGPGTPIDIPLLDISPDHSKGVMKGIIEEGNGDCPGYGDEVFVRFNIYMDDLTQLIHDNYQDENPLKFNLGRGQALKGLDIGIATMKKGEKAVFRISLEYNYGQAGFLPTVPTNTNLNFEILLCDWRLEDLSEKKNRSVLRKVLEKGTGTLSLNFGSSVKVELKRCYDQKSFDDRVIEFVVGDGTAYSIPHEIEDVLTKFQLKEKSLIYLMPAPFAQMPAEDFGKSPDMVVYEVTLLSFQRVKDIWQMNTDEKLTRAITEKKRGNEFVASKHYKLAASHFKTIVQCLENEPGADSETKEARKYLLLCAYLNTALVMIKQGELTGAIDFCSKALVLDPENEKAFYRRGQARMFNNDLKEALEDLSNLCRHYPKNKAARDMMVLCQEKIKNEQMKDKNTYGNMFAKFQMQDEKRLKNMETERGVWQSERAYDKSAELDIDSEETSDSKDEETGLMVVDVVERIESKVGESVTSEVEIIGKEEVATVTGEASSRESRKPRRVQRKKKRKAVVPVAEEEAERKDKALESMTEKADHNDENSGTVMEAAVADESESIRRLTVAQRLLFQQSNSLLREANVIELSNTVYKRF